MFIHALQLSDNTWVAKGQHYSTLAHLKHHIIKLYGSLVNFDPVINTDKNLDAYWRHEPIKEGSCYLWK